MEPSSRTAIVISLIGLVGVLGIALTISWPDSEDDLGELAVPKGGNAPDSLGHTAINRLILSDLTALTDVIRATESADATSGSGAGETTVTSTSATVTSTSATTSSTTTVLPTASGFRSILESHGVSTETFTDDQILEFGLTFCALASASVDPNEWEDFKRRAIEGTTSELSDDQLFFVIDASVVTFCPGEVSRLRITI